jgi:hypothetical protein
MSLKAGVNELNIGLSTVTGIVVYKRILGDHPGDPKFARPVNVPERDLVVLSKAHPMLGCNYAILHN